MVSCPLCVDVKSVNKSTIGNDLGLENYVNTVISNVRVLKRAVTFARNYKSTEKKLGCKTTC